MKVTSKNVILETTHRAHGMLEQGGISGRVVAYDRAKVAAVLAVPISALETMDENDCAPGRLVSSREIIETELQGRVLRKGHRIY